MLIGQLLGWLLIGAALAGATVEAGVLVVTNSFPTISAYAT